MLRKGTKEPVIRSYDKYTQFSSDNTVKVITTSNVFTKILSKINNDAIVKMEQEVLTNAFLFDQQNVSGVATNQDIPNADLAEEIITDALLEVPLNNQDESTENHPDEDKESQDVSTYTEVSAAAEDLNHGAGDGTHLFYYPHSC